MSRLVKPLLVVAALVGAGCLVDIRNVSDPGPAFREARSEAHGVQGRPGPARALNVLVFEPDEGQLVKVSLPLWLVRKIEREVDWDVDVDIDADNNEERIARRVKRHVRVEDLERAGLGVLVEVEEQDGSQVLIWLR